MESKGKRKAGGVKRHPVWLDCDPGHDDMMAIILALNSPCINLLGISTVAGTTVKAALRSPLALNPVRAGNQTLEKVTENAYKTLAMCGQVGVVDIIPGQARSLLRPHVACPEIHGESGLDHGMMDDPEVARVLATRPVDGERGHGGAPGVTRMWQVIELAHKLQAEAAGRGGGAGERIKLVAVGALTNVALLFTLYPRAAEVLEVVIMGGALGVGNTGAVAEYNIQNDPEAAKIVFESGAPVTMVPLEVTHTALVTPDQLARIRGRGEKKGTRFRALICELLMFFKESYQKTFLFEAPPLHDPCAIAFVIDPTLFETKHLRVDVECASPLAYGQTVCDIWLQSGKPPNVHVAVKMDVPRFWDLMCAAVDEADELSPLNATSSGKAQGRGKRERTGEV